MIKFNVIRWKNLLSTGNTFTEIKLNKSKSTLIVGNNGAGKSTILDALSFALYGKPFRNVNKPQLINSINKKGLMVELEFSIGSREYKICRGIKPNVFEIFLDDKKLDQEAAAKDQQEMLEKNILKMNHKSFSQVVVLGSSTYVPFMELSTPNRRQVIEDLLDIEIFTVMNSLLKDHVSKVKDEKVKIEHDMFVKENEIAMSKKHLEELNESNEELVKELVAKKEAAIFAISEIEFEKELLLEQLDKVQQFSTKSDVQTKIAKYNKHLIELNTKLDSVKKEIGFYADNDSCPTCKQDIHKDFKKDIVKDKKETVSSVQSGIYKLENMLENLNESLDEMLKAEREYSDVKSKIDSKDNEIAWNNRNISGIEDDIKKLQDKSSGLSDKQEEIDELIKEIKGLKTKFTNNDKKMNVVQSAAFLLKDGGIKARIVKQYIPIMNKFINKYLAKMDFYCKFELDENFNETIKSRHRDVFSYNSFSEGEKMAINIALMFTWRKIAKLRNSVSTNLLILDEVLDSSLDIDRMEMFTNLIHVDKECGNVFVISHNSDTGFKDKFHSLIRFEKHTNFSRIAS